MKGIKDLFQDAKKKAAESEKYIAWMHGRLYAVFNWPVIIANLPYTDENKRYFLRGYFGKK